MTVIAKMTLTSPWAISSCRREISSFDRAYVSFNPLLPNRVLSDPSKDGEIIGCIQPGVELKILNGPACENGWAWWFVRSEDTELAGWTAEGDYENYWLVPLPWSAPKTGEEIRKS